MDAFDLDAELAKIKEHYRLTDEGYLAEAIRYGVLEHYALTDAQKVQLARAVFAARDAMYEEED
jgi:hypothetical protein